MMTNHEATTACAVWANSFPSQRGKISFMVLNPHKKASFSLQIPNRIFFLLSSQECKEDCFLVYRLESLFWPGLCSYFFILHQVLSSFFFFLHTRQCTHSPKPAFACTLITSSPFNIHEITGHLFSPDSRRSSRFCVHMCIYSLFAE